MAVITSSRVEDWSVPSSVIDDRPRAAPNVDRSNATATATTVPAKIAGQSTYDPPVVCAAFVVFILMFLRSLGSAQADKRQDCHDDDNESYEIDDSAHGGASFQLPLEMRDGSVHINDILAALFQPHAYTFPDRKSPDPVRSGPGCDIFVATGAFGSFPHNRTSAAPIFRVPVGL